MKILITGGAGFIGSNLTEYLLEEGHEIVSVDNFSTGIQSNISLLKNHPRFSFLEIDVTELDLADRLSVFGNFDQIYHLACPTGVPNCTRLSEEMIDVCSVGVKNVLSIAHEHNASFLITSSSEVYGNPKEFPQTEQYSGNVQPISRRAPYEEGKRFAETMTMMFHRKYNVDVKITRLFNVYGPRMSLSDTRVIPQLSYQALRGETMTVHNGGDQTRTFCFIGDMVKGLVLVMNKGESGSVYNIGGDKEVTIKELAISIKSNLCSDSRLEHIEPPFSDHLRRRPLLDRVKQLGWKQQMPFEEGLQITFEDFKNQFEQLPLS